MNYIIFALTGDYSKVAEEIEKELKENKEETVSMEQFDMLSRAYSAKYDECEQLKAENRKLTAEVSKYRYFIECQRNEMDKL